jgi:hypothetical protein
VGVLVVAGPSVVLEKGLTVLLFSFSLLTAHVGIHLTAVGCRSVKPSYSQIDVALRILEIIKEYTVFFSFSRLVKSSS